MTSMLPALTTNVLYRMLWLGGRNEAGLVVPAGSAFVVEFEGKDYVVTAHHVVRACEYVLFMRHGGEWVPGGWPEPLVDDSENDITVFKFDGEARFSAFDIRYGLVGGTILGQLGYALGFPAVGGRTDHIAEFNGNAIAIPTMLAINVVPGAARVYCSGYVNAGYSGGAVVYPIDTTGAWGFAGTITAFPTFRRNVHRLEGLSGDGEGEPAGLYVKEHMGLLAYIPWLTIRHLIENA